MLCRRLAVRVCKIYIYTGTGGLRELKGPVLSSCLKGDGDKTYCEYIADHFYDPFGSWDCYRSFVLVVWFNGISTLVDYLMPNPVYIRGSLNQFPDFFRMGTFIDSTYMKL